MPDAPKKYRFKLLRGDYTDPDGVRHEPNTPSAFVNSDQDLAKKYGREMFVLVSGGERDSRNFTPPTGVPDLDKPESQLHGDGTADSNADANAGTSANVPQNLAELEGMTEKQLREFAAGEEIDLTGAHRKSDILDRIKAHFNSHE